MLTAEGCRSRRQRLWDALPHPCDLLIIADPSHLIYFANYTPSLFTFRANDAGALLVLRPDHATLVADDMVQPFVEKAHVDTARTPVWYDGKHSAPRRQTQLVQSELEAVRGLPGRRIGIEASSVPAGLVEGLASARPGLELLNLDPIIRPLRRRKDADEVDLLRKSMAAGEAGHAAALERLEPGMTEFDAFLLVQQVAMEAAGQQAIVYGDFEAGPRAQGEVAPSTRRKLQAGDLFILDFSVVIRGYRGDFANTISIAGKPPAQQVAMYEGCVAALAAGEALLRPGQPARAIDAALRRMFADRGLDPHYPTHSGHGVGLGHPEPPYIVPESDDVLEAGDVVTLEPGQYGAGFGGMRYERNYLITESGFETLTHHRIALVK